MLELDFAYNYRLLLTSRKYISKDESIAYI
jgi:hypothetical protein